MRTTVLSRSVVAVASLAIGSAALAAVPATAATPSGVTRDQVLAATNGLRAAISSGNDVTPATIKALRAIVYRACAVNSDDGELLYAVDGRPTGAGASADGLAAYGQIYNAADGTVRQCAVGAVASTTTTHVLSGTVSLSAKVDPGAQNRVVATALSGDVAVTAPIIAAGSETFTGDPALTASGAATQTIKVPAKTVKDKKTSKEKKAAKKKYAKKLASLKKSYDKAVKRAGSSKSRKAAAKKTYTAKKKAAKATYRYAIANYRIVKKATTTQDVRPFSITLLTL
jgi:mRNA-degrading endonuclease RelE of RelBE toxin-antitoxin system